VPVSLARLFGDLHRVGRIFKILATIFVMLKQICDATSRPICNRSHGFGCELIRCSGNFHFERSTVAFGGAFLALNVLGLVLSLMKRARSTHNSFVLVDVGRIRSACWQPLGLQTYVEVCAVLILRPFEPPRRPTPI
jgi:hypothetical protein